MPKVVFLSLKDGFYGLGQGVFFVCGRAESGNFQDIHGRPVIVFPSCAAGHGCLGGRDGEPGAIGFLAIRIPGPWKPGESK